MSNVTKKIIQVLMILCVAVVLAAGLFGFAYLTQHTPQPKQYILKEIPPDPETLNDALVLELGRNYMEEFNEDGSITRSIYQHPVEYRDENGDYQEIDYSITESNNEYLYENTTNVSKTFFKDSSSNNQTVKFDVPGGVVVPAEPMLVQNEDGTQEFVSETAEELNIYSREVAWSLEGANDVAPTTQDNTVTYAGVYDGVDAKYSINPDGIFEELILDEYIEKFDYPQLTTLKNVYYKEQPNGSITFHDKETHNIVFESPPPMMYEVNDKSQVNMDMHYEIEELGDSNYRISKIIDEAGKEWMKTANYPIVVDNSYIIQGWYSTNYQGTIREDDPCYSDNDWNYYYPAGNYDQIGGDRYPSCGTGGTAFRNYRAYMTFYTNGSYNSNIIGAKLYTYMYRDDPWPGTWFDETRNTISAYVGIDKWASLGDGDNTTSGAAYAAWQAANTMTLADYNTFTSAWPSTNVCAADPAQCEVVFNIADPMLIAGSGGGFRTQVVLDDCGPNNLNCHHWCCGTPNYAGMWSAAGKKSSAPPWPRLEVVYFPTPEVAYAGATTTTVTLSINDNTVDEDGWYLQYSKDGTNFGGEEKIMTGTTGVETGSDGYSINYDCSGTSSSATGSCSVVVTLPNSGTTDNRPSDERIYFRLWTSHATLGRSRDYGETDGYTYATAYPDQDSDPNNHLMPTVRYADTHWGYLQMWPPFGMMQTATNQRSYPWGGGPDSLGPPTNDNAYTRWCVNVHEGVLGYFLGHPMVTSITGTNDVVHLSPTEWNGSTPYCHWAARWVGFNGPVMSPFLISGLGSAYLQPNHPYIVYISPLHKATGESVIATSFNFTDMRWVYTRPRLPQPPIVGDPYYSSSNFHINVKINDTPDSPSSYTNYSEAYKALEYCNSSDTDCTNRWNWRLLKPNGGNISLVSRSHVDVEPPGVTAIPSDYLGRMISWGGSSGKDFYGFEPNTCYQFRLTAQKSYTTFKNSHDIYYGDPYIAYGEADNCVWTNDSTCGSLYGDATVEVCTPAAPPSQPEVHCNYDVTGQFAMEDLIQYYAGIKKGMEAGREVKKPLFNIPVANAVIIPICKWALQCGNDICESVYHEDIIGDICYCPEDCSVTPVETNDYYCEVDIVDPINPDPVYYNIQHSECTLSQSSCSSTWTNVDMNPSVAGVQAWGSDPGGIIRELDLTCDLTHSYYKYRVRASHESDGTNASDWSQINGDSLPPCAPSPKPNGVSQTLNSIYWNWTAPDGGSIPIGYMLYQNTTPAGSAFGVPWNNTSTEYDSWGGLLSNQAYYLQVAGRDNNGINGSYREGAKSAQSDAFYTLATTPPFDVECFADYCRIDNIDNTGDGPRYPKYCLSRSVEDTKDWEFYNSLGQWYNPTGTAIQSCSFTTDTSYWRSAKTVYDQNWSLDDTGKVCGTKYNYKFEAMNDGSQVTPGAPIVFDSTFTCPPYNVRHTNNYYSSGYRLTINWENDPSFNPSDTDIKIFSNTNCSGSPIYTYTTPTVNTKSYTFNYGTSSAHANTLKQFSVCYDKGGTVGPIGIGDNAAYTSIQAPTGVSLSQITESKIRVNRTGSFSNANVNRPSFSYRNSYSNSDSGGSGHGWTTGAYDDENLSANYEYCYQAKSRNSENDPDVNVNESGDVSGWVPSSATGACAYTLAKIPGKPIRQRVDEETINVTIVDNANPHGVDSGPTAADTEYAICTVKYLADGTEEDFYVQSDGSLLLAAAGCQNGEGNILGEPNAVWQSFSSWGGVDGINVINLDSSTKYGFKVKARNADNKETNFGPAATLFLVRNNVVGWAWSENVGWISLNCLNLYTDPELGYSCDVADDWGVNTNFEPTRAINPLEGYAWAASGLHIQDWLTGNVNQTGFGSFHMGGDPGQQNNMDLALDSFGNPHIVWSEYDDTSGVFDVYYLKRENNVWKTVDGTVYQPGAMDTIATGLNVSYNALSPSNEYSLWPTLDLDSNDMPHIAWREAGNGPATQIQWVGHDIYYTTWDGNNWTAASLVDSQGTTPSLKVTSGNQPMIAFTHGAYGDDDGTEVYLKKWEDPNWVAIDGGAVYNVSNTTILDNNYRKNASLYPDLEIGSDNNPHVVWRETTEDGPDTETENEYDRHIFYRHWNGSAWVSASNNSKSTFCYNSSSLPGTACIFSDGQCDGQCHYADESVNRELFNVGIDGGNLKYTVADESRPDLALDSSDNPSVLFNDNYYYTIFMRWNSGTRTWEDVDGGANDHLWINENDSAKSEGERNSKEKNNVSLYYDENDVPYITWTGSDGSGNYADIFVRYWDKNADGIGVGKWVTVNGDFGGGANFDDDFLTPYPVEGTHSSNSNIMVDDAGDVDVIWSEISLDTITDCTSQADCINPSYPLCVDGRCTRICTNDVECPYSQYPQCIYRYIDSSIYPGNPNVCGSSDILYSLWEAKPNKSGLGWISFNKYVCANDEQVGCSAESVSSNECDGNACVESAGDSPDTFGTTYGYCYTDVAPGGEKYGSCSKTDDAYCTESDLTECLDPTEYCIFNTCSYGVVNPQNCEQNPSPHIGYTGNEECRATATANFSGETGQIEGWARILSSKNQGERYVPALTDWGWLKLAGNYDDGRGDSGEFNLSGVEIDAQQFLGDPDVSADSLSLYTLLGWGWNANLTNYNSLSRWLPPYNITKLNRVNYYSSGTWGDVSMIVDNVGDTHMAWSEYNPENFKFDIYYAKLSGGKWWTVSGQEYDPEASVFSPNSINLDVSYGSGLLADGYSSRFPSLALDSNNQPHIALQVYPFENGGDAEESGSNIIYTYWNGNNWQDYSLVETGASQTAQLALDDNDMPYVVYKKGQYGALVDIYLKVWNGDAWNSITNDSNNINVSNTDWTRSTSPHIILDGSIPHVTWRDRNLQFYRWWNGHYWATAKEDETATEDSDPRACVNDLTQSCTSDADCASYCHPYSDVGWANPGVDVPCSSDSDCDNDGNMENDDICIQNECQGLAVAVNWGMRQCSDDNSPCYDDGDCATGTCDGISNTYPDVFEAHSSDIDLFSDGIPGIAYGDSHKIFFRKWDTINNEWTDINGGTTPAEKIDNVRLNDNSEWAKSQISLKIDENDQPQIIYDEEDDDDTPGNFDIRYLRWDNVAKDWLTINGNPNNDHDSDYYKVDNSPDYDSRGSTFGFDQWGNPHIAWIDTQRNPDDWRCGYYNEGGYNNSPSNASAMEIVMSPDDKYMYVVGSDDQDNNGDTNWRIEKRRADYDHLCDGTVCEGTAFDGDGIIRYDSDDSNVATDITIDDNGDYIFVAGNNSARHIRIQKHDAKTGALDTNFDGDGIISVPETGTNNANNSNVSIEYDGGYIYLVGTTNDNDWYIEKRDGDTGELVYDFGDQGSVISTDGYGGQWMSIENNFMYIVGGDDSGDWRIEKRYLSSGDLVTQFANNGVYIGPGPGQLNQSYNSEKAYQSLIQGDYLYVAGATEEGSVENFLIAKFDKMTGIPDPSFDDDGFMEISDYLATKAFAITADEEYLYFGGYTGDSTASKWRIEKIDFDGNRPAGATNAGWNNGIIFENGNNGLGNVAGRIDGIAHDRNYIFIVGSSDFSPSTWRIEKRWKDSGILDKYPEGTSSRDCYDSEYPVCAYDAGWRCVKSNVMYSMWTPGNVQGGIGWVEFMPAGALLGVPWLQTSFADIFGTGGVNLAPPPRGSGQYTATYLILSDGSVQGIPTNYSGNYSQSPTSQLYQFGLNPLIEGGSLPFGKDALSQIKFNSLITNQGDNKNKYGHDLVELPDSEITEGTSLGTNKVLDNSVYYYNGNATISNELLIEKGEIDDINPENSTAGDGLLVINGDLEINSNIYYQKECSTTHTTQCLIDDDCPSGETCVSPELADISEMQSMAILVRGNIYINPFVTHLDTALIAIDNPLTEDVKEGLISTSRKQPTSANIDDVDENDIYINYDGANNYTSYNNDTSLKFGQESSSYEYRKKIFFSDVSNLGEVNSFPLQVYIDSTKSDIWSAINDPAQVNFTDANGVSLDFHFEKFDDTNNEAVAWVEVPTLTTDGNDYIWIYYGGSGMSSAENEPATYDDNFKAVYHLEEDGTNTRTNSTQFSHDATPMYYDGASHSQNAGDITNIIGKIDGADQFDGELDIDGDVSTGWHGEGLCSGGALDGNLCYTDNESTTCPGGTCDYDWEATGDYLDAGTDILNGRIDFTVEAWFKTDHAGRIIEQRTDKIPNNYDDSQYYEIYVEANGNVRARAGEWLNEDRDGNGEVDGFRMMWDLNSDESGNTDFNDNAWHYVTLVQDTDIDGARLYVDGIQRDSQDNTADPILGSVYLSQDLYTIIGSKQYEDWGYPKTGSYFHGALDEIKISDVARSEDYVLASYLSGRNTSGEHIIEDSWGAQDSVGTTSMDRTFLRWSIGPGGDGISIPPGAEIRDAYIEFDGTGNSFGDISSRIYLIDEEDMSDFNDYISNNSEQALYNIDVTNSVAYHSDIADWAIGDINKTPDIKALISRFINSDTYENNYNNGSPTSIGVVIQEDPEDIGGFREFYSAEGSGSGTAPKLVVEYSPRRVRYDIDDDALLGGDFIDDTVSYKQSGVAVQSFTAPDLGFGYSDFWLGSGTDDGVRRGFVRYQGIDVPKNAEIINSHIRATIASGGTESIEMRQGLLTGDDSYFDAPFNNTLDSSSSEVSQQVGQNEWLAGETVKFADISKLVKAFIARPEYEPGVYGYGTSCTPSQCQFDSQCVGDCINPSAMAIRLRVGGNDSEYFLSDGQNRAIEGRDDGLSQAGSFLEIDYRVPIEVNGLMVATGFNFDRKYSQNLAPAERIVYDGRVLANTPPGLSDFTKTLPIYQRVAP